MPCCVRIGIKELPTAQVLGSAPDDPFQVCEHRPMLTRATREFAVRDATDVTEPIHKAVC